MYQPFTLELHSLDSKSVEALDVFETVSINQDIESADNFTVTIPATKGNRDLVGKGYRKCVIKCDGIEQFTGWLNEINTDIGLSGADIVLTAQSTQAILQQVSIPTNAQYTANLTFRQYVDRITSDYQPTYISSIKANNAATHYLLSGKKINYKKQVDLYDPSGVIKVGTKSVNLSRLVGGGTSSSFYEGIETQLNNKKVEPSTMIWDCIVNFGKQIAIHPFFAPDNSLSLTRPNYSLNNNMYDEGIIVVRDSGGVVNPGKSTVKGARFATRYQGRSSEYIVYGQGKPKKTAMGKELARHKWSVKDPALYFHDHTSGVPGLSPVFNKPRVMVADFPLAKEEYIRRLARREMETRALSGFEYRVTVPGVRSPSGIPWMPDTMVNVSDEWNNISTPLYIKTVAKELSQSNVHTVLTLMPPNVWLADVPEDDAGYYAHMKDAIWW